MEIKDPESVRQRIRTEIKKYIKSDVKARNLEKAIYNWSIDTGKERKIITKWIKKELEIMQVKKVFQNLI